MTEQEEKTAPVKAPKKSWTIAASLMMASFVSAFAGSSLNVSIPTIGAEFHVSAASLTWLLTAFTMCTVALSLPLGRLGDLTSRRALLIFGLAVFSIANLASSFAQNMQMMVALRIFQGIGGACMFTTNQAILVDTFPPEVRGKMLGISTSALYFGLALGPVFGGFITQHFGWRYVFMTMAAMGALTFLVAIGRLPKNSGQRPAGRLTDRLDIPGMLLYMSGIVCLAWGLNNLSANTLAFVFAGIGLGLLGVFVYVEHRVSSPLLSFSLFKNSRSFTLSNLAALFNFSATFAITYLVSLYLQRVRGLGADVSGFFMLVAPFVQGLVAIIAGRLSDRHSPFRLASFGCICCTLGLVSYIFVSPVSPYLHIIVNMAITGVGFGFFASPNTNAIMSQVQRKDLGIVTAFLGTMRNLGQIISLAVVTTIMTVNLGSQPITEVSPDDLSSVMRLCFIILSVICTAAVFTSFQHKTARPVEVDRPE